MGTKSPRNTLKISNLLRNYSSTLISSNTNSKSTMSASYLNISEAALLGPYGGYRGSSSPSESSS